ncbi:MAG: hypothetical protein WBD89_14445, partial [Candidatus Sulfotelmatobacter sp.]
GDRPLKDKLMSAQPTAGVYANAFRPNTVSARLAPMRPVTPQAREEVEFYAPALEQGMLS